MNELLNRDCYEWLEGFARKQRQRIMQTETGPNGNCQSACLATLLGIPLADIPNFTVAGDDDACFAAQQNWLAERGYGIVTLSAKGPFFKRWFGCGYIVVGGTSPRGLPHSCIYKDGKLWHDPHPEGGGITEVTDVDVIWPLDFAALSRPGRWAAEEIEHDPDIIIAAIIKDIRDRRGIGDEWDAIDVDIRNEIVSAWRKLFPAAPQEPKP